MEKKGQDYWNNILRSVVPDGMGSGVQEEGFTLDRGMNGSSTVT